MTEITKSERGSLRVVRSFVRRQGRMTAAQHHALTEYWPLYGCPVNDKPLDFAHLFNNDAPTILDIGFGMGESLLTLAQHYPHYNFIGAEVHRPGVGALLANIHKLNLTNIRVFCEDVNIVLKQMITSQSLMGILIFFPDPWHKKRHQKRRLIQIDFVNVLAQKLKSEGILHMATDWEDYAVYMQTVLSSCPCFEAIDTSLVQRPPTKYEQRGKRLGHGVWDLQYRLK